MGRLTKDEKVKRAFAKQPDSRAFSLVNITEMITILKRADVALNEAQDMIERGAGISAVAKIGSVKKRLKWIEKGLSE